MDQHALTLGLIPNLSFMPTLAEAATLVSWWKPLLLVAPMVPWGMICAKQFDKFMAMFHLSREKWNLINLVWGTSAFLIALLMPIHAWWGIFVSFAVLCLLLAANIFVCLNAINKDDRIPKGKELKLFDNSAAKSAAAKKSAAKNLGTSELVLRMPDKQTIPVPAKDSPDFPVRTAAEALYLKAVAQRAAQVDLVPGQPFNGQPGYVVTYFIDSVKQQGDAMAAADAVKIIDLWKSAAKLDINDRRKRLVGDCRVEKGTENRPVRIVTMGTTAGQRLTILIDPEKQVTRKFPDLGLTEPQQAELDALITDGKGVVLLAAPPDQGRTTTLYTIVRKHDAYTSNVQTVEMDIQASLEGARQNKFEAGQADGPEYSTMVRSILRRDPDVVAVAELPDANTAKEIAKADQERTRIYLSISSENALAAIQGYVQAVGDPDLASKSLRGVVAQRLIRRLCGNCKQAYQPSPDMLKKLGLPADKVPQLFKKGGQVLLKNNKMETCPGCAGVGYYGAEGVFEVYMLTDAARAAIKAKDFNALKAELRKKQLPGIQQVALKKAVDGITSVEEVMRISEPVTQTKPSTPNPEAKPAAPAAAAAQAPAKK
ncbi:MAG: Flp pilus assembly complex ATPase component TadA [Planctomycetes bacterium]|nr:Flp pilus assembly complex ATPase component TadA [Planctomycetota bacterium]